VCVYKGTEYHTGQRWRDGCDYNCVCVDGMSGQYQCTDRSVIVVVVVIIIIIIIIVVVVVVVAVVVVVIINIIIIN
jgi:hypothetical protein